MSRAHVEIDLAAIEHNARSIVTRCAAHGVEVMGVTKGVLGHPDVAAAMVRGGVSSIGDSRLDNIARLRESGVDVPVALIRAPTHSELDAVVELVEVSFHTELLTIERLAEAAAAVGRVHDVIVMVDLGERREGVLPASLPAFAREVRTMSDVRLVGIGTNLSCFTGLEPTSENMRELLDLARRVQADVGMEPTWISGGGSSALPLIDAGTMPAGINQLRIGEAILLGLETAHHRAWPGTVQDAMTVRAEVVEVKDKPPAPHGPRSDRAFARTSEPPLGEGGRRALIALGRADLDVDGLTPLDEGHRILGATSDYLVVDVTGAIHRVELGDELSYRPDYGALVTAVGSAGVETRVLSGPRLERKKG